MHGWLDWLHASVSKGLRLVAIQRERNRHHKLCARLRVRRRGSGKPPLLHNGKRLISPSLVGGLLSHNDAILGLARRCDVAPDRGPGVRRTRRGCAGAETPCFQCPLARPTKKAPRGETSRRFFSFSAIARLVQVKWHPDHELGVRCSAIDRAGRKLPALDDADRCGAEAHARRLFRDDTAVFRTTARGHRTFDRGRTTHAAIKSALREVPFSRTRRASPLRVGDHRRTRRRGRGRRRRRTRDDHGRARVFDAVFLLRRLDRQGHRRRRRRGVDDRLAHLKLRRRRRIRRGRRRRRRRRRWRRRHQLDIYSFIHIVELLEFELALIEVKTREKVNGDRDADSDHCARRKFFLSRSVEQRVAMLAMFSSHACVTPPYD